MPLTRLKDQYLAQDRVRFLMDEAGIVLHLHRRAPLSRRP
jgi:hypothetical protein